MNSRLILLAAMTWLGLASARANAELYVICNSSTPIEASQVKAIFTGEQLFMGGTRLYPLDNSAAQDAFLSEIGLSVSRYNTIWTKKSFREGLNPPPVKAGDHEVNEYVRKTPGAIGYVTVPSKDVSVIRKY